MLLVSQNIPKNDNLLWLFLNKVCKQLLRPTKWPLTVQPFKVSTLLFPTQLPDTKFEFSYDIENNHFAIYNSVLPEYNYRSSRSHKNLWIRFHTVRQVSLENFTCIKKIMRLLWQKTKILHFFHGNFWDTLKKTLAYRFVHNNFKFVRNPSYNGWL